jgi:hypothetical protein
VTIRNGAGPASAATDSEAQDMHATGERPALSRPDPKTTQPTRDERPIASIKIGKRHRRDLGDVAALAASIEDIGLINPITVDENGLLLAGGRRLAACKQLGWKQIPVCVVRCAR